MYHYAERDDLSFFKCDFTLDEFHILSYYVVYCIFDGCAEKTLYLDTTFFTICVFKSVVGKTVGAM